MPKFIHFMVVALLSPNALALPKNATIKDCSAALSTQHMPLDFAISDYEGLFLELVQKVQLIDHMPPDRHEYLATEILNMKAQLLNRTVKLLPFFLAISEPQKKSRIIASVYQILDSLGIPPAVFGLKVDEQNQLVIPVAPGLRETVNLPYLPSEPIGFIKPTRGLEPDLAEGLNRSIGFAPQYIREIDKPKRHGGFLKRAFPPQNKNVLIVADGETNSFYYVDLRILTSARAQFFGKTLELTFNPEIAEWMVEVKNLFNPTGKIGFL